MMKSSNKSDSAVNTESRKQNPVSVQSLQSQMLLEALQNYINPFVKSHIDMYDSADGPISNHNPLEKEASSLLSALHAFISSVIRSQTHDQAEIRVDLSDNQNPAMGVETGAVLAKKTSPILPSAGKLLLVCEDQDPSIDQQAETPLAKILALIRERVFNKMPIRPLHIIPDDSDIQIRLLERSAVCNLLAAQVDADFSTELFNSEVSKEIQSRRRADPKQYVIEKWAAQYTKYTILSHTWIHATTGEPGYHKLTSFCKTAWINHGLTLAWMDTICINKDSSSELDESIRSMYKWYEASAMCIIYLADTINLSDMHRDPWFTRGWTFQELLAPTYIRFYNAHWNQFSKSAFAFASDKDAQEIPEKIYQATSITKSELCRSPKLMPISRKMQLAAGRKVTREEDTAYSLMGICGVSISIAYGEGQVRAFTRLMIEILNSSRYVMDIFNGMRTHQNAGFGSLIPSSPSAYLNRSTELTSLPRQCPIEPIIVTHLGLRIPVLLMPSLQKSNAQFQGIPYGDYYATVHFKRPQHPDHIGPFYLLDKGIGAIQLDAANSALMDDNDADSETESDMMYTVRTYTTFGILNCGGGQVDISVPKTCLAVGFVAPPDVKWETPSIYIGRHYDQDPIVFDLMTRSTAPAPKYPSDRYSIARTELERHGMRLVTMYL
ncbi:hypothetical protein BDN70DRAFT_517024 [Pholiota conissans]|uniref:Heterokaryon incompatibility domain-containing protein n=1 Tax=Pholiota conissans TaxID=109636 RepID=A0A9P5YMC3_9AGAR|nr:hypothetical protein BDN70DRAFT_517024 [Pholiota conissans]